MSGSDDSAKGITEIGAENVARVPTLLLLDTSHSMNRRSEDEHGNERSRIDQLNDGLEVFKKEIEDNYKTEQAVDVSLITFGGSVDIEQEFTPITDWQPPTIDASGNTPLCEAIIRGSNVLDNYRSSLRDDNVPLKKALVWLLTDGRPTDDGGDAEEKARAVIRDGTDDSDILFYGVGISDEADMDKLEDLASAAPDQSKVNVFPLKDGMFEEFFRIVSESAHGHSEDEADEAGENTRSQQ